MDKDQLFQPRLPERDVVIDGVGTVRVRGLSRHEAILVQAETGVLAERKMLHFGMVDPALSEAEVTTWQHASPAGELEPVTLAIADLSGIGEGAAKAAYKSVER